jgi:DNA/RNA-binding domain of Phe-tRNA-synthetase-like protein
LLTIEEHPLLAVAAFITELPKPLTEVSSPPGWADLLKIGAAAPIATSDEVRTKIRDVLRHGGFKPTGRSKPASEYLLRAATEGTLGSINALVDACNIASLHSGLPISVVDLDKARAPLRIAIAPAGTKYVFNASGQEIDVSGLVCLFDADGPCANAVKDAQRTKTDGNSKRTLSVVWSSNALAPQTRAADAWYRDLLGQLGAKLQPAI